MTAPDTFTDDPIIHIPTDDLRRMTDRAYWSAAAAWSEYRNVAHLETTYTVVSERELCDMLRTAAESADDYCNRLSDECNRRDAS